MGNMKFIVFSRALQELEQTSSRLEMTEQLAELYQKFEPDEIKAATYLMQGRLVPEYRSLEFNLSTKLIQRALAKLISGHQKNFATQTAEQADLFGEDDLSQLEDLVKNKAKKSGDIGETAQNICQELNSKENSGDEGSNESISLLEVFSQLEMVAAQEGKGSQERKIDSLIELWEQLEPLSVRYVTRIVMGELRLGFSTMTLLDALSWATHQDKSVRNELELAYNKQADVGRLATAYLTAENDQERQELLDHYAVENGVPVVPALAQRLNTTKEVVEKMGKVIAEPKYDGLRVQLHFNRGEATKAFTRNLDEVSQMFPELEEAFAIIEAKSCILDSEAIGYDPDDGQLLPFQKTVTRRRKHDISSQAEEVPIRFYIFDLLELDGESLVDQPLEKRKEKLSEIFPENEIFYETQYKISNDPDELREFHRQQLANDLEGAVFKKLEAPYRGGRKGWRWVKMKEAGGEQGQLSDTLDCVVMGYYAGKGKRAEFGIGAILVGVRDKKEDKIKTITKIGTGLTDEQFKEMKKRLDKLAVEDQPAQYQVPKNLVPDVWAAPSLVIEVAADAITDSPVHEAGVALRFPRLIEFRDDKDWEQATTLEEVKQIQQ